MKWDIKTLPFLITGALAIVDLSIFDESITKPEECPNFQYACPPCPSGQQCVYPNSGGCEGAGIPVCQAIKGCFGQVCLMRALPCPKECPFFCKYNGPPCCPFLGQPVCQPQCQTFAPCQVTKCPAECPDDCFYPNAPTCCPKSGKAVCRNQLNDVSNPPLLDFTDLGDYIEDESSTIEDDEFIKYPDVDDAESGVSDDSDDYLIDYPTIDDDDDTDDDNITENTDDIVEDSTDLEGTTITEYFIPNTYKQHKQYGKSRYYGNHHRGTGNRDRGVYQDYGYGRQNRGRYYGSRSQYNHQNDMNRYNRYYHRNNGYHNNYPSQYRGGWSRGYQNQYYRGQPAQHYRGHSAQHYRGYPAQHYRSRPVQPQPNWVRKSWNYKDRYPTVNPVPFPGSEIGPEAAIDYFPIPGYQPDDPKNKNPYGPEDCKVDPNPAAVDYGPIVDDNIIDNPYDPSVLKDIPDINAGVATEIFEWRDGNELTHGYPPNPYMSPPFYVDRDLPEASEKESLKENDEDKASDGSNLDREHPLSSSTKLHQMCPLFILPCPPECPDDCIYPKNVPCPFTKRPSCPPKKSASKKKKPVSSTKEDVPSDATSTTYDEEVVEPIHTVVTQPVDIDLESHGITAAAAANNKPHVVPLKHEPALPLPDILSLEEEIIEEESSFFDSIVSELSDESF